jgi:superfamily II DNA or RNA helicase
MKNTYLGQKGYTIPKNELTIEEQKQIRNDLMIKPYTPGAPGGGGEKTFPAYRESSNKMYVPHYYGMENYGPPKSYKISEGKEIQLDFNGSLRENQEVVVKTYIDHVTKSIYGGGLLELPCAYGKCLGKDTPILMYNGTIKNVQDIVIGDFLMGDDSTPRKVLSLARGREQMYKISSKMGDSYICNESHILSLKFSTNYSEQFQKGEIIDISVKEFLDLPKSCHGILCGYKVSVEFAEKELDFDPYFLGYWLGKEKNNSTDECNIQKLDFLRKMRIPQHYLCNSREKRLSLLAGLMDSNGVFNKINIKFAQKHEGLVDDIIFLARSLGFACYKQDTKDGICIYGNGIEEIPFLKKEYVRTQPNDDLMYRLQIQKLEIDDYYGFEIDGNRRFVLGDFTVTHNTVLSLSIISRLKKKTFIIVHKEFLMNQWIERINQFLPKARVGKIQGQIIDIDDKDIVIGMLQSLSMKEYPAAIFESFGLTIIDEVHHISSEVFSNSLFKLVTKYMLGLSATMNRKDGTTKVFKMFLGDVIFKGKRDEERNVIVRAIEYNVDDDDFNKVATDFRGNPAYSTMISKLCEYNRRSEFILKVLCDMLLENPSQQVMILAHNKNLLKYLHDAISHRNIATVGYYVGGMKESALKDTETKKIVIATYAMAAEALDIKTLTTIIMATPKTEIEQSVGRILREKHSNPIVVDIVDSHDLFKNQWQKRRKFYCKENYKILYTISKKYNPDTTAWRVLNEPKLNKNTNQICKIQTNSSTSSSEDEETQSEKKDSFACGKCLLTFKKQ